MSVDEDIDYLSGIISQAASGLLEIGLMEGFKVARAFISINGAGKGKELGARFLAKLWNTSQPDLSSGEKTPVEKDLDYLAGLLANIMGGAAALTAAEGFKMNMALKNVRAAGANKQLVQRIWINFCQVNPQAQATIRMAAAWSPALATWAAKAGV